MGPESINRLALSAVAFAIAAPVGLGASQQGAQPMDYDTYCKLATVDARQAALAKLSPAEKAEVLRTP